MSELWRLSAIEIARLVRTRKISAREVGEAALQRLDYGRREDLYFRAGEAIEARGTPPAPIDPSTI